MKGKLRVLVYAALCVALGAAAAFAGVTINGKALSNIDDIVLETTGSRTAVKGSYLTVRDPGNNPFKVNGAHGNVTDNFATTIEGFVGTLDGTGGSKTNTGVCLALGQKRAEDGSIVVMLPAAYDLGIRAQFFNVSLDPNERYLINALSCTPGATWSFHGNEGNFYISDAAGGLFPYGKGGKEVFAVAYFKTSGKRPGFSQEYTAYLDLVDSTGNYVCGKTLGTIKDCVFPSVRIATGDFNHDGKVDEIAVIRDGDSLDPAYIVQVFRAETFGGVILRDYYTANLGRCGLNVIGGCDIAAGDFDHDGQTDLAAVYTDVIMHTYPSTDPFGGTTFKAMADGYPAVTVFRKSDSGFELKSVTDTDEDLKLGSGYMQSKFSIPPQFGIVAEAGDLDGDGRDELVFLTPGLGTDGNVLVSVWGTDGNLSPSRKLWQPAKLTTYAWGGTPQFPNATSILTDRAECSYLPRSLSLALVPLGEKLPTGGAIRRVVISQCQGGDTVTDANGYYAGSRVEHLLPTFSNGVMTGFEFANDMTGGSEWAQGLLPGDFYNETVELGDPDHMVFEAERSYVAEIQTPPYHVDYVQAPFEVNGKKPTAKSVLNMTFMGSNVTYSKSETDSTKTDVAFKTASAMDWGVSAKADAKIKLVGVSASGGYKDTATKVENAASSSEAKTTLTVTDTTDGTDNVVLYKTDRHVWRYPILSPTSGAPADSNGDCFMTFSLCDTPETVQGNAGWSSQYDDYNPIHEEGNLFSYPTKIEDIPCYGENGQVNLTQVHNYTTGGGSTTIDLTVSESGADTNGTTTTSKKAVNGSVSVSIPIPKILNIGASATAAYSRELTNTETFTKSYASSEKFTVNLKSAQLGFLPNNITHLIKTQLYTDLAGIMKVGFAVDLQNNDAPAWRNDGMYGASPDIALVLPAKFGRFTSVVDNVTRVVWSANKDRRSAIQLRGIRFLDESGKMTTSTLVRGKKYTIEFPVYNASFKAPNRNVAFAVDLRKVKDTEAVDEPILSTFASGDFSIGGWTRNTKDNKAMVSFDWEVPTNLSADNYDLYFTLDPKNEIIELHENWDAEKDPGGNNVGRYPIAILEKEPEAVTASVKIAAASESDFKILFRPIREDDEREWLTFPEFREELARAESHDITASDGSTAQTKDFRAFAKVVYSGSDTLTNLFIETTRTDADGSVHRVAFRSLPALFPNTEREVSFMVSPEKLTKGTFNVSLTGDAVNLHWGKTSAGVGSSSSGGCNAGFSELALLALAAAFLVRPSQRSMPSRQTEGKITEEEILK